METSVSPYITSRFEDIKTGCYRKIVIDEGVAHLYPVNWLDTLPEYVSYISNALGCEPVFVYPDGEYDGSIEICWVTSNNGRFALYFEMTCPKNLSTSLCGFLSIPDNRTYPGEQDIYFTDEEEPKQLTEETMDYAIQVIKDYLDYTGVEMVGGAHECDK